ncbi:MAG TPA: PEP-CTERM sorting domain-containing protein [Verrucomicrobiae bacterium]|nr:PEP-CTERM sorting domain-containing protein [Verrucomicrobiae bacterium]
MRRKSVIPQVCSGLAILAGSFSFMGNAATISLGDASFEDYVLPSRGYAYAADPLGAYRPSSAWVDDLNSPAGYTQDDGNSNWIYNTAYGESSATHRRAAPRTGNQAMHGLFHYNAQTTSAVFELGKTYTFSLWAQGDIDASGSSSRIFLYIFDGSVPFSEANSLTFKRFAPDTGDFVNRSAAWTTAESQAGWTQISLSYTVLAGSSAIGHTIGVGFWLGDDASVDDASLTVVPEPTTGMLLGLGGLALLNYRRRRSL